MSTSTSTTTIHDHPRPPQPPHRHGRACPGHPNPHQCNVQTMQSWSATIPCGRPGSAPGYGGICSACSTSTIKAVGSQSGSRHHRLARGRQRWRMIRLRWLCRLRRRRCVQPVEPPLQRCIAAIASRWRRGLHAVMLIRRATEADVHMRGVIIPRSHQAQPRPVTLGGFTQLPLDRGIDQYAIDVGQARRQMQQGHHVRRPARQVNASLIRPHHAWQFHRLALRRSQSVLR